MGKGLREELAAKIQSVKTGIKIRNTRAEQGRVAIEEKKKVLKEKQDALKLKEEEREKANQEKERLEKIEDVERNLLREKKQLEKAEQKAANNEQEASEENSAATEPTTEDGNAEEKKEEDVVEEDDDEIKFFKNEGRSLRVLHLMLINIRINPSPIYFLHHLPLNVAHLLHNISLFPWAIFCNRFVLYFYCSRSQSDLTQIYRG